jgi:hypothetical protein
LSLPDLEVLSRTPIVDGTGVQWGAAVHRDGDELLIYGVADEGENKLHRTNSESGRNGLRCSIGKTR